MRSGDTMTRLCLIPAVLGVLRLLSPALAVSPQINLTITPEHIHVFPGTDFTVMCKADVPLTHCQFKIRHLPVYDLSDGAYSEFANEYSYYGEGLEKGECGIQIVGKALAFVVYVVGCRVRAIGSDWAFREAALINKRRAGLPVTISPSRTLILHPGDPIKLLVDAHVPLSHCGYVLANDFSKTNNNRRFSFDKDNVPAATNAKGTDMEFYGNGTAHGQCGFQVAQAREEYNDGAWIDAVDEEEHEETLFFRLIIARAPIRPLMTYKTTTNLDGSLDIEAMCSVRSRPASNITWYLEDKPIDEKFSTFVPVDDWLWPSNIIPVTQRLTLKLGSKDNGKSLYCAADHISLKSPVESEKFKVDIISPPSIPKLEIKSPFFSVGSTLNATCHVDNWNPDATITWFLGGVVLRQDKHNDDTGAPANVTSITQHLRHLMERRENGLELRCEVAHPVLVQPLKASSKIVFTHCSPLVSKTVGISCSVAGEHVDCAQPQLVGTVAQLACKPGHIVASSIVYRRVTCLRAVRWDRPVFSCTPACGRRNTNSGTTLISNGEDSKIGEFPWHIGIYERSSPSAEPVQTCGGTLISPDIVVSAAHCFWSNDRRKPKDASRIVIAAGKHVRDWEDLDLNVQKRNVSKIIIPLRYSGRLSQFASDIALLRLEVEVEMTATVNLICIDWENELERSQLKVGKMGTVAGWGYTESGEQSKMLKYVNLPYISPDECARALSDEIEPVFTHDKFCAGYVNQSTSVCRGDSGGGLVFLNPGTDKYYLRGIVSIAFTPPSNNAICYAQLYTGFTKLSNFLSWVQENI